jgi:hypothetical protein
VRCDEISDGQGILVSNIHVDKRDWLSSGVSFRSCSVDNLTIRQMSRLDLDYEFSACEVFMLNCVFEIIHCATRRFGASYCMMTTEARVLSRILIRQSSRGFSLGIRYDRSHHAFPITRAVCQLHCCVKSLNSHYVSESAGNNGRLLVHPFNWISTFLYNIQPHDEQFDIHRGRLRL